MFEVQLTHPFGRPTLKLVGELTIYTATEARRTLWEALERDRPGDVDLGEVRELDTAGAQLLVWLKQEARTARRPLAYLNHNPAVVEVLDLLNLAGTLGDPILMPPDGRD